MTSQSITIDQSLLGEMSISYSPNPSLRTSKISNSETAIKFIREIFPVCLQHREAMVALFLNRANLTIGYSILSIGGIAGTVCDPKVVFQNALLCNASGIILSHNHPSGLLKPSRADESLTQKLLKAGEFLDIQILDHIILTQDSYFSFANEGMLK